ncbi:IclR family transcriptional regulator [Orrella sp. 11846]|uniref:IclR family transcriptional regulator n=1 Tax=Orrella sp. 11846 TaxID=3409913 RepID=UPI003B5A347A
MGRTRAQEAFKPGTEGQFSENDPALALTLARGLMVLKCFDLRNSSLGNKELVEMTGLSKAAVSRMTYTLTQFGFLRYSPSMRRYSLGLSLLTTAYPLLAGLRIRQIARPLMQQMANEIGGVVSMGMQLGRKMVYIESCVSAKSVSPVVAGIGSTIPIFPTAMGRAYLCGLSSIERKELLDTIAPEWDESDNKYLAQVTQALEQYDRWGFCLAKPNLVQETRSVGVAVKGLVDDQHYAFNCGMPIARLKQGQIESDIGPRLFELVRNVELLLGVR